jgi:hypothetical protein
VLSYGNIADRGIADRGIADRGIAAFFVVGDRDFLTRRTQLTRPELIYEQSTKIHCFYRLNQSS